MRWSIGEILDIIRYKIVVEPVGFLASTGAAIYMASQMVGMYRIICQNKFDTNAQVDCTNLQTTPDAEDYTQSTSAEWGTYVTLAYLFTSMVGSMYMGAWSDINGRKVPIMIGIFGTMFAIYGYVVVISYREIPLFVVLITDFFAGFSGFLAFIPAMCSGMIADMTIDPDLLTVRLAIFVVLQNIGSAVGGAIGGAISSHMSLGYLGMVGLCIVAASWVFACIRVPQVSPQLMKKRCLNEAKAKNPDQVDPPPAVRASLMGDEDNRMPPRSDVSCAGILSMVKESLMTYVKKRAGNKRAFILCFVLIQIMFIAIDAGTMMCTSLVIMRRPISFGPDEIGYFMSITQVFALFGSFFGSLLFKKVLKLKDTSLVIVALMSLMTRLIMMGFATIVGQKWFVYVALFCGCFSRLSGPAAASFLAQILPPDDMGKIFAAFAIALDIGMAFGSALHNGIYEATVSFFPGVVFFVGVFEVSICVAIVTWIHFQFEADRKRGLA